MAASGATDVAAFFGLCFRHRHSLDTVNRSKLESWFGVSEPEQATALLQAGREVVLSVLYVSTSAATTDDIAAFLDKSLDPRLVTLIAKVILAQLPTWREASVEGRVSMPRLVDVDWRVDVKTSAEALTRMSVPTLMMDVKIRDQAKKVGVMPPVRSVTFEMSREAVTTMLTGLHKIRDQLSVLQQ